MCGLVNGNNDHAAVRGIRCELMFATLGQFLAKRLHFMEWNRSKLIIFAHSIKLKAVGGERRAIRFLLEDEVALRNNPRVTNRGAAQCGVRHQFPFLSPACYMMEAPCRSSTTPLLNVSKAIGMSKGECHESNTWFAVTPALRAPRRTDIWI